MNTVNMPGTHSYPRILSSFVLIIICILSLMSSAACSAPQQTGPEPVLTDSPEPIITKPPTTPSEASGGKTFIWEISSDISTIYLLGSIHVASSDIYPLNAVIENAFQTADNLVVEIDISQVNPMVTANLLMEYGTYPQGESLKNAIPESLYMQISDYFGKYGVDIVTMDMFRPWVIDTLMEELRLKAMGYSSEQGIDMYFIEKAIESNKNIIELETAELQLELMSSFSDELMILVIEDAFDNPPTREMIEEIFNSWENGDTAVMESMIFEGLNEDPVFEPCYQAIYIDRNYNMADKIEEFLGADEVYFVIVGAAHLVGEEGLVNILEDRGYRSIQLLRLDD